MSPLDVFEFTLNICITSFQKGCSNFRNVSNRRKKKSKKVGVILWLFFFLWNIATTYVPDEWKRFEEMSSVGEKVFSATQDLRKTSNITWICIWTPGCCFQIFTTKSDGPAQSPTTRESVIWVNHWIQRWPGLKIVRKSFPALLKQNLWISEPGYWNLFNSR